MSHGFTARQGQYLAFVYHYTKINRRPPAEADIQRYFGVSAPSVPQMILMRSGSDRFGPLGSDIDFAMSEMEAITEVIAHRFAYRAVIAGVDDSRGRPSGKSVSGMLY